MDSERDASGSGELSEDELRERLAGPHQDGRAGASLERELPIGPADDGGGLDQGPHGTTHRGTGGDARGGASGEAIDASVTGSAPIPQGSLEEEATPEDVARLRRAD
jgi:hypothetical protein